MFSKILIANRGEIACRIIETARKLGVKTVAVYSEADANARHVKMADEAVLLGAAPSRESYLLADKVIAAAKQTGAQAIHPGYGFLSENADFCRMCEQENIVFIGPPVGAIEAMGSKSAAKNIMGEANVPLVPGYHGEDQSMDVIKQSADDMGYPVLLKAAAGGGGKGMRQVWSSGEFAENFDAVKREALSSFGDDTMLVEKYLTKPRHVEIQVFCDSHGNAVYLFERDCSVQRRHQKVIEEAPAFGMTENIRQQMGEAAIKSAQAIGYVGAGTVEFLLNPNHDDFDQSEFYFMEMNTRLQVEHPVTEMITGEDLVEWQLKVASGEVLPKTQDQLSINGYSFEARVYAEDPHNDFLPATGRLTHLKPPESSKFVRVDTGVEQGDEVSVFYDPMIAKLIVWDETREKALQRLTSALKQYQVHGVTTNIDFLHSVASCEAFKQEDIDTGFIEKHHDELFNKQGGCNDLQFAMHTCTAAIAQVMRVVNNGNAAKSNAVWQANSGFRLNQTNQHKVNLHVETQDESFKPIESTHVVFDSVRFAHSNANQHFTTTIAGVDLTVEASLSGDNLTTVINGFSNTCQVVFDDSDKSPKIVLFTEHGKSTFVVDLPDLGESDDNQDAGGLTAPMNGTVIDVLVKQGDNVEQGQALVIMEAMKMEHTIRAPKNGEVTALFYNAGDMVDGGAELLGFEAT